MEGPKTLIVLATVVLLLVPLSGCLDVQTWKTLIKGPEQVKVGYREVEGPSQYWSYDITTQDIFDWIARGGEDPPTDKEWEYGFKVKPGTTRITLSYNLNMTNPPEEAWAFFLEALNRSGGEDYRPIIEQLKDMDRGLNITLIDPNGVIVYSERNNETTDGDIQYFVIDPKPGLWALKIECRGIGFVAETPAGPVEYHDTFEVWTLLRVPYYE